MYVIFEKGYLVVEEEVVEVGDVFGEFGEFTYGFYRGVLVAVEDMYVDFFVGW